MNGRPDVKRSLIVGPYLLCFGRHKSEGALDPWAKDLSVVARIVFPFYADLGRSISSWFRIYKWSVSVPHCPARTTKDEK